MYYVTKVQKFSINEKAFKFFCLPSSHRRINESKEEEAIHAWHGFMYGMYSCMACIHVWHVFMYGMDSCMAWIAKNQY
jgi:hypothetical protein